MKSALKMLAVLAAVQALLVGVWYAVEQGRADPQAATPTPPRPAVEPMDRPAPALGFQRSDGTQGTLADLRGQPVVLHFWATWCKPCREELPALLAFAAETGTQVLAVSLDPGWDPVRRFIGGDPPKPLALGETGEMERAFGLETLPVTYLISPAGRMRLRLQGPQQWSTDSVRALVRAGAPGNGD